MALARAGSGVGPGRRQIKKPRDALRPWPHIGMSPPQCRAAGNKKATGQIRLWPSVTGQTVGRSLPVVTSAGVPTQRRYVGDASHDLLHCVVASSCIRVTESSKTRLSVAEAKCPVKHRARRASRSRCPSFPAAPANGGPVRAAAARKRFGDHVRSGYLTDCSRAWPSVRHHKEGYRREISEGRAARQDGECSVEQMDRPPRSRASGRRRTDTPALAGCSWTGQAAQPVLEPGSEANLSRACRSGVRRGLCRPLV